MSEKSSIAVLEQRIVDLEHELGQLKTAKAQQQKELFLRRIMFQQSRDGVAILDKEGGVYEANQRFADMLGYSLDEVGSLHIWDWDAQYSKAELLAMIGACDKVPDFFQTRHRRKDHTVIDIEMISHSAVLEHQPLIICFCRDISKRKMAEESLEKERNFLKTLFSMLPDLVCLKNPDGEFITCNPRFEKLIGAKEADLVGKTDYDFLPPERADYYRQCDLEVMAERKTRVCEEQVIFAEDGHEELLETITTPMYDRKGDLIGVLGIFRNITAFRKAEEALRESQSNLLASQRIARIGHYTLDITQDHWTSSEMLDEIFGIDADYAHTTQGWLALIHPEERDEMAAYLQTHVLTEKQPFDMEYRIQRAGDHAVRWVHGIGRLDLDGDGRPRFMIGTIQDITGRKEAEILLHQQEMLLREAGQIAHFGGWEFDPLTLEGSMTEETLRIHDLDPDSRITVNMGRKFYQRESLERFEAGIKGAIEHGKPFDLELEFKSAKGVYKWVRVICHPTVRDSRVLNVRGSIQDITESKKTALELQLLAEAMDQASEGIFIIDVKGRITYANPAVEKISGYTLDEIRNKNIRSFVPDNISSTFTKGVTGAILNGNRWAERIIFNRKEGVPFTAEVSISPLKNKKGRVARFVGIIRDISSELKIEERLSQAQKMEAIGTLAGGIAHDFNNILSPLIGYAELLKLDIPSDSPMQPYVAQILNAAGRAKNLVMQILTFSRQTDSEFKPIKIQPIVKEALNLLRSSIPTTIDIVHHIDPACGPVVADATQVHQIVMNLATNAYHSMEEQGGQLTVSLKSIQIDEATARLMDVEPGPFTCLGVIDTGCGMEKEVAERIFDPYFTTKDKTRGTGLGLSVVQGIVKSSAGHIQVFSQVGQGTEFRVYLPIINLDHEKGEYIDQTPFEGGNEKILIVDDEEMIALVTQRLLERLGYRVAIRVSSIEALETIKDSPHQYDLVISDMTMPQMTGDVLAKEMKKIRPTLPIIISTGFSERMNPEKLKALGIEGFLMKPLDSAALAETVRKVLETSSIPDT